MKIRAWTLCVFSLFWLGATLPAVGADQHNDGMQDEYELFFGLNPNNPADAEINYDSDYLFIIDEHSAVTDPFKPDTDGSCGD